MIKFYNVILIIRNLSMMYDDVQLHTMMYNDVQ